MSIREYYMLLCVRFVHSFIWMVNFVFFLSTIYEFIVFSWLVDVTTKSWMLLGHLIACDCRFAKSQKTDCVFSSLLIRNCLNLNMSASDGVTVNIKARCLNLFFDRSKIKYTSNGLFGSRFCLFPVSSINNNWCCMHTIWIILSKCLDIFITYTKWIRKY